MDAAEQALRKWLGAKATQPLLRRIAARIDARFVRQGLRLPGQDAGTDARAERIEEIQADLSLYLLEKAGHFGSRLRAGAEGLEQQLLFGFMNHLKDQVRNYNDDPFRYLYRRSREVLNKSPGFHTALRSGRYLVFSLKPENESGPPLSAEERAQINFPPGELSRMEFSSACRRGPIRHFAGHFWREACALRGGSARWVDLRDFCVWLCAHLALPTKVPADEGDPEPGSFEPANQTAADQTPVHLRSPDEALRASELQRLAACLYGRLTERERRVCLLRDGFGLKWEEIARRLGYRGPTGPLHRHAAAQRKMVGFLRDLSRLSPEDFAPEDFKVFQDSFFELLKNGAATP